MTEPDPVLTAVGRAIQLTATDPNLARVRLRQLWTQIGETGDPLHRCAVAHQLADLCPGPAEELAWDLRALAAADEITPERAAAAGMSGPAGLYPSLHLNLGEAYRKRGDRDPARRHLDLGLAAVGALGDDGYGAMIRRGLQGLADRLAQPSAGESVQVTPARQPGSSSLPH